MSLQVWLPLTGDLHNQGLSAQTVNITTTPVWSSTGKLSGQSLYTKTRMTTMNFPGLVGVSTYSVAYWLYIPTATAPTAWSDMFGIGFNCAGSTVYERDERRSATTTGRHNYHLAKSASEGSNTNAYYGTREDDSANDKWVHYTLVKDDISARLYADAQLVVTVPVANFETTKRTMTGTVYLGDNGCEGYLQDFRIYDHALSIKEIEEIAKGLVLHYKLDNNGLGGENLALNTKTLNVASSKNNLNMYIRGASTRQLRSDGFYESKGTASWHGLSFWANQLNLTVGTKVTYSFYIYGNGSSRAFSFYPMMYNSAGTRDTSTKLPISIDGGSYTTVNSKPFENTTATAPEYHYVTLEWNQAVADIISNGGSIELSIQVHGTWNDGDWACLFAPKVEIGDTPTPWSPNPADLNIDSSIIYDSSGYENNGIITGDIQTDGNTARYSCSMKQTNGQYIRVEKRPAECLPKDKMTINFWMYCTTWGNPVSCTEGGGWNFENGSTGIRFPVYISGVGYKYQDTTVTTSSLLNAWHMLTGVFDGSNVLTYIDGELKTSVSTGSTNGIGYANNYLFIGAEASGNSTTPASSSYAGNLSDFRIYATALTAAQILELYHTSASIDNDGNIYTRELVEE